MFVEKAQKSHLIFHRKSKSLLKLHEKKIEGLTVLCGFHVIMNLGVLLIAILAIYQWSTLYLICK